MIPVVDGDSRLSVVSFRMLGIAPRRCSLFSEETFLLDSSFQQVEKPISAGSIIPPRTGSVWP
jgi:hypothetical protein